HIAWRDRAIQGFRVNLVAFAYGQLIDFVVAVELHRAGCGATPTSQRSCDDRTARRIDGHDVRAEYSGDSWRRRWQRNGVRGNDMPLDRAHIERVIRIVVEDTQAGTIIVCQWRVRLLRRRPLPGKGARRWSKREHHGAPNSRMTEPQGVAQFVGENGFQVVGTRIGTQCLGSGEGG